MRTPARKILPRVSFHPVAGFMCRTVESTKSQRPLCSRRKPTCFSMSAYVSNKVGCSQAVVKKKTSVLRGAVWGKVGGQMNGWRFSFVVLNFVIKFCYYCLEESEDLSVCLGQILCLHSIRMYCLETFLDQESPLVSSVAVNHKIALAGGWDCSQETVVVVVFWMCVENL